jgi:hypothetical protein
MFCARYSFPLSLSLFRKPSNLIYNMVVGEGRRRMTSTLPRLPIFEAIAGHDPCSTVVLHSVSGRKFTYGELLGDVAEAKERLLKESGSSSISGERIAFLVENSYDYVGAQLLNQWPFYCLSIC